MAEQDQRAQRLTRVFLSYAHDEGAHAEAVRELWRVLRGNGLDAHMDWPPGGRRDMTQWMHEQIRDADFVLVMASPEYRRRAEGAVVSGRGRGVQFEAALIREALYRDRRRAIEKFLPVLLPGAEVDDIPEWLGPTSATHYRVPELTASGADRLLRVLTGQPVEDAPSVEAPALARGRTVTILHLGGPRVGPGEPDGRRDALVRSLDQLGQRPDLVVVSGDLAESGRRAELERAAEFLESLAAHLDLGPGRLAIVPGSGDVNRDKCEAYFRDRRADDLEPEPPYWPKWQHFAGLVRRLHDPAAGFTVDQPWTLHELPDSRVVVAALNSTIRHSHRHEDQIGWVGTEQLEWFAARLRAYANGGWLRVGVVHHALRGAGDDRDRLSDAGELERILAPELDLLLHGRAGHAGGGSLSGGLPVFGGGADAYQLIRVEPGRVVSWPRRYGPDERRWTGDGGIARSIPRPARGVATAVAEPERGSSVRRRTDDFLERVAEVCRLRRPGATVTRVELPADGLAYLRVAEGDEFAVRLRAVGACPHDIGQPDVDRFARVHERYRQADPYVLSELVYGGARVPDELRQAALRRGIRLVSFLEHQGVLDLRGYVERQTQRLRNDPRYPPALYVPQRYSHLGSGERTVREDLLGTVLDWFRSSQQGHFVLVLGDFGSGKSFLTRELFRRIIRDELPMTPVLVQIGSLQKTTSFDALIANHLSEAGEDTFDLPAFRYMLREGRIALLLDGYDELANRVTYDRAAEHLQTLLDAFEGRAKMLLTSRTQHFRSTEQVLTAIGARIAAQPGRRLVQLERLEEPQIRTFLSKLLGDEPAAERRFGLIAEVQDLLGLSENPRMLSFIAELEEERLVEVRERRGRISAAELYRLLLQQWLERERRRAEPAGSAPSLTVEQRWRAATQLALELWPRPESTLRLDQLAASVAEAVAQLPSVGMGEGQAAHAVGSGTLLVRDDEDGFGFVHRSVLAWVVAAHAAEQIGAGRDPDVLRQRRMSALMADFLCDLASRDAATTWARREIARAAPDAGSDNALMVLDRLNERPGAEVELAGRSLRGADLSGIDLRGADLRGIDLEEATLVEARLQGAVLIGARLRGARLDRADLTGADLSEADLSGSWLLGADLRRAVLNGCVLRRAALLGARLDPGALDEADVQGAALPADRVEPQYGDGGRPCAVAFSPAGDLIVTGAEDGAVWIWETASGRPLRALAGHRGAVRSVAASADGRWLASAGADGTVRLWEAGAGRSLAVLDAHQGGAESVVIGPDGRWLASAGMDGTLRLWELPDGLPLRTLEGGSGFVKGVAASPDGTWLASAGADGAVRLWDVETGRLRRTLDGAGGPLWSVAIGRDGEWLVSAGADGVRLWEPESGLTFGMRERHTGRVQSIATSPDGGRLASAGDDGTVRLWEPENGCLRTLAGHAGRVQSVAISRDGRWVASAGADGTVRLWEAEGGRPRHVLGGDRRAVGAVAIGRRVWQGAAGTAGGTVQLWAGGRLRRTLEGHVGQVHGVAISPDERWLVSAGDDGVVQLWETATGELRHGLDGHRDCVRGVAFSPASGRWLASAGDDGAVRIWETETGQLRHTLEGHSGPVRSVAFSPPDGRWLASAGADGTVRLWSARRLLGWQPLRVLEGGHRGVVECVAFSGPDGRLLASAGPDGVVRLWDAESGQRRGALGPHRGGVRCVVISADGFSLFSAGDDGAIQLWDPDRCRHLRTLEGHRGPVHGMAIDRSGRWLVSAGADGTVRVWNLNTAARVAIVPMTDGAAYLRRSGEYGLDGVPAGELWYAAGLCRFEPGQLDDYVPSLRRLPDDAPLLPP